MKKSITSFLITLFLIITTLTFVNANTPIKVYINDEKIVFDNVDPIIVEGRVLVPVRGVFEKAGAIIDWDNNLKSVDITYNNVTLTIVVDKNYITYKKLTNTDAELINIDVSAKLSNGSVLIPLSAISNLLEADVAWNDNSKSAYIYFNDDIPDEIIDSKTNNTLGFGESIANFEKAFGKPDRKFTKNSFTFLTYINDYSSYLLVGFSDNKLTYFLSNEPSIDISKIKSSKVYYVVDEKNSRVFTQINFGSLDIYKSKDKDVLTEMELQVWDINNAFRETKGVAPLSYNNKVADIARAHSKDMAVNDYFAHEGLDGNEAHERAEAAGIKYSYYGENIAFGYDTPLTVINAWIHSTGHRENMIEENFEEIGVGIYVASDGTIYYNQNFLTGL